MIRIKLVTIAFGLFVAISATGQQSKQQIEELYKDANAYYYFEDYEEALALYLRVYGYYTDNFNLDYRIGFCYLNIPGQKHKAIPHLERAANNITRRYSEHSFKETQAPVEALFYLGNAYFIDNQFEKAQQSYDQFLRQIRSQRLYDIDYLNHQISSIKRSKVIRNYPVNFMRRNLGQNINNHFPNYNPVVSGDGKTLAFTTKQRFYQAIFIARKEGNTWGRPQNITLDLVVDGNCSTLSLSYSGDELYLFKDVDHVGNIYVSNYKEGRWGPMRKLNANINTSFYETHACVSSDGRKLYFTSNRAGGFGDLDIYVSERVQGGDWGPAVNLGPNVNSRFNENTPFLTTDGNTLYFSSEGHNTMGGYDIFFSQKQSDGTWSQPVNLGYPINTTDDDLFYHPLGDGSNGLMALFSDDAYGETDIYQIEIFLPKYQRSIISFTEYYDRKDDLPKKTLIVDTLNFPGFALLDPSKPEHTEYLGTDKKYTLFFDGKAYNLKDQSFLMEKVVSQLAQKSIDEQESEKSSLLTKGELTVDEEQLKETTYSELLMPASAFIDTKTDTLLLAITSADSIQVLKKVTVYQLSDEEIRQREQEKELLSKALLTLADKDIKHIISSVFDESWESLPSVHWDKSEWLVYLADSLGKTEQLIALFAELMDIINKQSPETHYRQSRKISNISSIEDFFFKFQQLKKKASPGLAEILDYAILTNSEITSFSSLWDYLYSQKFDDIYPYLLELLGLFADNAIEGFFALTPQQKESVYETIQKHHQVSLARVLFIILFAVGVVIFIVFYLKRKRKQGLS